LQGLGLHIDLQVVDDATRLSRYISGQYDVSLSGPTLSLPSQYYDTFAAASKNPKSEGKHDDPRVSEFFDRLSAAKNVQDEAKIAQEMERYVAFDKVYGAWLFTEDGHQAYRSYVKGVAIPADNYRRGLSYERVWLHK